MTYATREDWLTAAVSEFSVKFVAAGLPLPDRIRVSCSLTSGGTRKRPGGKVLTGECWDSIRSGDKTTEVMISPVEADPVRVLGTLAHELCHAATGKGHRGEFGRIARELHLEGPLNATQIGQDFKTTISPMIKRLGNYPHAKLDTSTATRQSTRMIKCCCPVCGYTVRTAKKWLAVGLPRCPAHGDMPVA